MPLGAGGDLFGGDAVKDDTRATSDNTKQLKMLDEQLFELLHPKDGGNLFGGGSGGKGGGGGGNRGGGNGGGGSNGDGGDGGDPNQSPSGGPEDLEHQIKGTGEGGKYTTGDIKRALAGSDGLVDPVTGTGLGGGIGAYRSGGGGHRHEGLDILAPYGSPIYAAGAGTIITNPHGTYQGDAVTYLRLDNGMTVAYMHHHLNANLKTGSRVAAGQQIGTSGRAAGVNHLHFETWAGAPHRSRLLDPRQVYHWDKTHLPRGGTSQGKTVAPPAARSVENAATSSAAPQPFVDDNKGAAAPSSEQASVPHRIEMTPELMKQIELQAAIAEDAPKAYFKVGNMFPHTHWDIFEREARPSALLRRSSPRCRIRSW